MISVDIKGLLGRLNRYLTKSLNGAAGLCVSRTHYEVSVAHLLLVMVEDPNADLQAILRHFEVDPAVVLKRMQAELEELSAGNAGKPVFSPTLLEWVQEGWLVSSVDHHLAQVRSGVLLYALLRNPLRFVSGDVAEVFSGIPAEDLKRNLLDIVSGSIEDETPAAAAAEPGEGAPGRPAGDSALDQFCTNFTQRARDGEIDPIFGRDREIRQMVDILARRRKNNPIVVGEAGVGKTAVVEGLALRIVEGDVPDFLKKVELLCLDLGLLQAGASMKGQFEERLKNVIAEIKASEKPLITFIDEAHTLIGAGGQTGGGDAANLLKPALARGELRTVAATTWSEYKKYFEKDPALARRFQLVKLDEPSAEDTVVILRGLKSKYEEAHGVRVSDEAAQAASYLSDRYISGRYLPDKAVDLLDTSSARVKIGLTDRPAALQDAERTIQTLERELRAIRKDIDEGLQADEERVGELDAEIAAAEDKRQTIESRWLAEKAIVDRILELRESLEGETPEPSEDTVGDGEQGEGEDLGEDGGESVAQEPAAQEPAAKEPAVPEPAVKEPAEIDKAAIRTKIDAATAELQALQDRDPLISVDVTPEVVGQVVADWTGIPVGKMVSDEAGAMLKMGDRLRERIKGQDPAIDAIVRGIQASKAGVGNPDTPIGVFLLVGPSGVGKTETGLGIADTLFGGERFMCTINMSEFQEKHTVSRLIGSPPGYVGYGEGGVLTEAVRQRPYSVVLLDECEKADPEVLNLFYQVFDKGSLSDGEGREIDFKNTVVMLTSNLATETITQMGTSEVKPDPDELVSVIRPELSAHFKPALLARMTIVPFFPIDMEAMRLITRLKLNSLGKRLLQNHKMVFEVDETVIDSIAERCTEVETGARNIDHIMQGTLLPQISTAILEQMAMDAHPDRLGVGIDSNGEFTYDFGSGEGD